jgi:hypothetical protein
MATTHSDHAFLPEERPLFPGSPYTPAHPTARRIGYLCSAVAVGILGMLGNALVTVNISPLAGGIGLYVAQANWLPAVFVAMNASANLLLIRARVQFGIPFVTRTLVLVYIAMALLQFVVPGSHRPWRSGPPRGSPRRACRRSPSTSWSRRFRGTTPVRRWR